MLFRWVVILVLAGLLLGGCATPKHQIDTSNPVTRGVVAEGKEDSDPFLDDLDDWNTPRRLIADPLEPLNRGVFWVNDKLYFYFFKPVARGYRVVVPQPARISVRNFFTNLGTPVRVGNALLQFKFENAGTETYRFIVNSTMGIGGLFDPATSVAGVNRVSADFGQTLGRYGFGHGLYLVLPVVGPSSLRDGAGTYVDSFADPLRYSGLDPMELLLIRMYDSINRLSLDRDTYEGVIRDALDPYLFIRDAYVQRRAAQVGEGVTNLNIFTSPVFSEDLLNPLEWFRFDR